MARAATAFVDFEGDFSRVGRGAGPASRKLEGTFNSSFRRIATFAAGALAAIGVGKFLKDSFKEAENAVRVSKLTNAVLKSTGSVAKVSAGQVEKLATSLSAVAGVDDEVIQQSENVLLTFTKVRNEVGKGNDIFTQGAQAALNLSSALGTDLQGATIQVGKALNDPIKGITALRRVGVSFTAQQIDQVKAMVASGHAMDAQKLILKELTTEFGGAAAANATASAKLGVAFKNIEEAIGGIVLPVFEKLATFITVTAAPAIERFVSALKPLGGAAKAAFVIGFGQNNIAGIKGWLSVFSKLGAVIRGFVDFIKGDVVHAGIDFGRAFGMDDQSRTITTMIKVLANVRKAMVTVVDFVGKHWKPILAGAAAALFLLVAPVVAVIAGLAILYLRFKSVRDGVQTVITAVQAAIQGIKGFVGEVRNVFDAIGGFFTSHSKDFEAFGKQFEGIAKSFMGVWNAIVPLVKGVFVIIAGIIAVAIITIVALWDRFGKTILDKLRVAFNAIAEVVRGALQVVQGIIEIVTGIITLKWGRVWNGLKDVFGGAWHVMAGIVKVAVAQISSIIAIGVSAISAGWFKAWQGFNDGIAGIWGGIERTIGSAVNGVIDIINGLIGAFNKLPFVHNIGKIGHVHWAEPSVARHTSGKVRAFHTGGIFDAKGGEGLALLKSGEGVFTKDQMKALSTGGQKVDARTIVQGNVYGDSHLRKVFADHDQKLQMEILVGHR